MANITVKKADGTTDIVYSALNPSSGDKVSALWRSETAGASGSLRPTLDMQAQWNGPRTARRVTETFQYPFTVTDTTTGVTTVKARIPMTLTAVIPVEIPDATIAEAINQFMNLNKSTLIIDCFKIGFGPT